MQLRSQNPLWVFRWKFTKKKRFISIILWNHKNLYERFKFSLNWNLHYKQLDLEFKDILKTLLWKNTISLVTYLYNIYVSNFSLIYKFETKYNITIFTIQCTVILGIQYLNACNTNAAFWNFEVQLFYT